jgi:hypothetical protein
MDTLLTEIMIVYFRNCGKTAYKEGRSCTDKNITSTEIMAGRMFRPSSSSRPRSCCAEEILIITERLPLSKAADILQSGKGSERRQALPLIDYEQHLDLR